MGCDMMVKLNRVAKTAFIPEDVYKEWEKKNTFTTWSGWVNSMVLASINGSSDFLAEQKKKIELMEEQVNSASFLTKELEKNVVKESKIKEASLLEQDDIRKAIALWNKYHFNGDGEKAEKVMAYLKEKGLSRAEVVSIAFKDKGDVVE
jgi:hypothetical protein